MSDNSWLPAGTDRSYGTNSNDVSVTVNEPFKGGVGGLSQVGGLHRAQAHTDDGLVTLPNGMTTTAEAARAAGLPATAKSTSVAVEGEFAAPVSTAKADEQFDKLYSMMTPAQMSDLATQAAQGDEQALDFANKVAPDYVQGIFDRAHTWMAEAGLNSPDALSFMLNEEDQYAARIAAINGDRTGFERYIHRALSNAQRIASEHDIGARIYAAGGELRNGFLFVDGQNMGSVVDCLLNGTLYFEDDE